MSETTEKRPALFIRGNRTGYSPSQIEDRTMTVADLIDALTEMGEAYGMDARVFLRNDGGYTYGEIEWDDLEAGRYDADGSTYDWDGEEDADW